MRGDRNHEYVVSLEGRCSIVGVFGNTGETGESSTDMFGAMVINISPPLLKMQVY